MKAQWPPAECGEEDPLAAIKEARQQLGSRIETLHNAQIELVASLQTLVPNLVSDLDFSQKTISAFNARSFTPLPSPLPAPRTKNAHVAPKIDPLVTKKLKASPEKSDSDGFPSDDCGGPLTVVRSMVAVCLLERVPFMPIDSSTVLRKLENDQSSATAADRAALRELGGETGAILAVEMALRSMAEDYGGLELEEYTFSGKSRVMVMNIDRTRLLKELPESKLFESNSAFKTPRPMPVMSRPGSEMWAPSPMAKTEEEDLKDLEALLNKKSFKEMQKCKTGEELMDLIHRPTIRQTAAAAKFKSKGGSQVKEYCTSLTKEDCHHRRRQSGSYIACEKVHFRRIIALHTDLSLGDCPFLSTCRHMKTCRYAHYELDSAPDMSLVPLNMHYCSAKELGESQWINCDIRSFRMDILGQFGVIMADPPWDIHMELPYGTMADDEMRALNVPALQTDGLIFLWVTGRAMELGRECLELWGYKRTEEIIWVKTNQLQRIIRTGRTGHWLNHSKEHCLVGIKGNPDVNRNIDTDVLVAEVRETSRKPDEMYPLLERIMPGARKLELFARTHNCHHGWMSLGNQLNGVRLVDDGLRARFKAAYPDVEVQPPSPPRSSAMDVPPARTSSGQGDTKTSGPPPAESTPATTC